jgi:hypothetical protein
MPFLIKLLLPRLINFVINIIIEIAKNQVKNTNSKIDDTVVAILENEKDELKEMAVRKARETGIYKRLK